MTASEAREKVLAVYPDAKVFGYHDGALAVFSAAASFSADTGYLGWGQTTFNRSSSQAESEAWIDAASRLPAPKPIEPAQVETVEVCAVACGHPYCWSQKIIDNAGPAQVESGDGLPPVPEPSTNYVNITKWELQWRRDQLKASLQRERELKKLLQQWMVARPIAEYHEDLGCALWFKYPIDEPPYVGTPNDSDWTEYHTHFVRLTNEMIPVPVEKVSSR